MSDIPQYDHTLIACPKCGSTRYVHGSPMGPVDLNGSFSPLYRFDSCLDCKHGWIVNFPKQEEKKG